jgi:hypothetical protein
MELEELHGAQSLTAEGRDEMWCDVRERKK